jgi:hypothetical protein
MEFRSSQRVHEVVALTLLTQVPLLYAWSTTPTVVAGTVLLLVGLYLLVPDQLLRIRGSSPPIRSYQAWLYREVARLTETQVPTPELRVDPIAAVPTQTELSGHIDDLAELAFLSVVSRITGISVLSLIAPLSQEPTAFASVDGQMYRPVKPVGHLLIHWAEDERFTRLDVPRLTRDALRFAFVPAPVEARHRIASDLLPRIDPARSVASEGQR